MTRSLTIFAVLVAATALGGCAELLPSGGRATAARNPSGSRTEAPDPTATAVPSRSASGIYRVTIGVTSRSGRLGAVQFDARARGGDWRGSGAKVACRNVAGAAMMACNDKGGGLLSCALIDQAGITTPKALVVCDLGSANPVAPADVSVRVTDASTPDMKPAKVSVAVTGVAAN